jgi:hypothetical protein
VSVVHTSPTARAEEDAAWWTATIDGLRLADVIEATTHDINVVVDARDEARLEPVRGGTE